MSVKIEPTSEMLEIIRDTTSEGKKREEIAKATGISRQTLATWIMSGEYPEVNHAYMEGKRVYANDLAERILDTASAPLHENPKLANAQVQRQRLIVETTKWIACKLMPKVYGDNIKVDHAHTGTITMSPLAQLRSLEEGGYRNATPPKEISTISTGASITEDDCF